MRVVFFRAAVALATAVFALAAPAVAAAQEPLPACTDDADTLSIEGLPGNLVEGKRTEFSVVDEWYDEVDVSFAVEGQAPYWTGVLSEADLEEDPNLWIQADRGDGPLVVVAKTRHEVEDADGVTSYCEVAVSRRVTHSPPQPRIMCSSYDGYANYPVAKRMPGTCTLGQQNWSYHAQGFVGLHQMRWQRWGEETATARAVWRENMGSRAQVRVTFYRPRQVDDYRVYTRARIRVVSSTWGGRGRFVVKLPTREA